MNSSCLLINGCANVFARVAGIDAGNVQDHKAKVRNGLDAAGVLQGAPVELPLDAQVGVVGRRDAAFEMGGHAVT